MTKEIESNLLFYLFRAINLCFFLPKQEVNDHLQDKLRSFKLQVEDAEEIAALNLAKFRKSQSEVEEAEKRANIAEQAMGKLRARSVMRGDTPVRYTPLTRHT